MGATHSIGDGEDRDILSEYLSCSLSAIKESFSSIYSSLFKDKMSLTKEDFTAVFDLCFSDSHKHFDIWRRYIDEGEILFEGHSLYEDGLPEETSHDGINPHVIYYVLLTLKVKDEATTEREEAIKFLYDIINEIPGGVVKENVMTWGLMVVRGVYRLLGKRPPDTADVKKLLERGVKLVPKDSVNNKSLPYSSFHHLLTRNKDIVHFLMKTTELVHKQASIQPDAVDISAVLQGGAVMMDSDASIEEDNTYIRDRSTLSFIWRSNISTFKRSWRMRQLVTPIYNEANLLTCGQALDTLAQRKTSFLAIYDRISKNFEGVVTYASLSSAFTLAWRELSESITPEAMAASPTSSHLTTDSTGPTDVTLVEFNGTEWELDPLSSNFLHQVGKHFERRLVKGAIHMGPNSLNKALVPDQRLYNAMYILATDVDIHNGGFLVKSVVDKPACITGIFTRKSLLQTVYENEVEILGDLCNMTIEKLLQDDMLQLAPVLTIGCDSVLVEGLLSLTATSLSSAAVVNFEGQLIGIIEPDVLKYIVVSPSMTFPSSPKLSSNLPSLDENFSENPSPPGHSTKTSDMNHIKSEATADFRLLSLPINAFAQLRDECLPGPSAQPSDYCCCEAETLSTVIRTMMKRNLDTIYIVQPDMKPTGAITVQSILALILTKDEMDRMGEHEPLNENIHESIERDTV